MKELTIEQKAQRYDEAIETTRKWYDANTNEGYRGIFEEIFPELKKSEDDNIKSCIGMILTDAPENRFNDFNTSLKECLAWLEKQGEQKHIIIPKFRVGDEICWKGDIDNNDTIAEICDGYYLNPLGNRMDMSYTDTNFELVKHEIVKEKEWTINDAKDGDMLSYSADDGSVWLMIFQSKYKPYEGHLHYHALLTDELYINGTCCLDVSNLRLSNEEERKMLFKEIQKEGYVWDSYGLELKKIEQKTVEWSEEDEKMLNDIIKDLVHPWNEYIPDRIEDEIKWLKNRLKSPRPQSTWKPSDGQMDNK